MSGSVIFVWDPVAHGPLPKSIGEALERSDTLLNLASPPSAAVLAFAERLNAYLSENREQFEDDPIFMEAYNGFYSKVSGMQFACLPLETPFHARQRFLWAVVTLAQEQALVVTDDILGMAYLPGGKVYPTAKAKLWKGLDDYFKLGLDSEFPTTLAGFRKIMEPQLEVMLLARNFTLKNKGGNCCYTYERTFDDIKQTFSFECQTGKRGHVLSCSFSLYSTRVSEICCHSGFVIFEKLPVFLWALSSIKSNATATKEGLPVYMKSHSDMALTLNGVENYIFEALDICKSISGVNQAMNGDVCLHVKREAHHSYYMPTALTVARLTGSDEFDDLCSSLLTTGCDWRVTPISSLGYQEAWARLVKYLREEVQPLPEVKT